MTRHDAIPDLHRRRMLRGLGTIGLAALAGCSTALGGNDDRQSGQDSTESTHLHAKLTIEIQGEPHDIPSGIGIGREYSDSLYYHSGMQMTSIHTHDDSGTIHWEIMGRPPKEGELNLGAFFEIWGVAFSEREIFENRADRQNQVMMVVNGEPSGDFAEYTVNDGDDIVIRYRE